MCFLDVKLFSVPRGRHVDVLRLSFAVHCEAPSTSTSDQNGVPRIIHFCWSYLYLCSLHFLINLFALCDLMFNDAICSYMPSIFVVYRYGVLPFCPITITTLLVGAFPNCRCFCGEAGGGVGGHERPTSICHMKFEIAVYSEVLQSMDLI